MFDCGCVCFTKSKKFRNEKKNSLNHLKCTACSFAKRQRRNFQDKLRQSETFRSLQLVPELEYKLVLVDLDLGTAHEKLFESAVVCAFMTKNHRRVVHD